MGRSRSRFYRRDCLYCGRPFSTHRDRRGRRRKYCSPACRQAAYRARQARKESP